MNFEVRILHERDYDVQINRKILVSSIPLSCSRSQQNTESQNNTNTIQNGLLKSALFKSGFSLNQKAKNSHNL